ncbi:putative nucleotide-diphospho-sugar transferase [Mangrovicoccus ximenensis]|uniref:putative nucleotide-diphospho-sugar transferase n=1 Tax=Mangrovicoccus ximenensis TaxID=1911570 RepID=UPI000D3CBF35|nr:putative nucleotide-diphospho-sugar transferase [Mangrovicoccus ximenensis]
MPWATPESLAPATCGFVLAASGRKYATAAEAAARTLKQSNPDFEVDIFTDQEVDASLFGQVHKLDKSWFRPKFEALIRSRFDRTIYLDVDLVVLGDMSDVFFVLGKYDIAAVQATNRNQGFAWKPWRMPLPNAFPQINGGMIALRRSDATLQFLKDCQQAMVDHDMPRDQPVFREMLWHSDLRLHILPPEYNVRNRTLWQYGGSKFAAPRVLHHTGFVARMKDDRTPVRPEQIYGRGFVRHVQRLIAADRQLTPGAKDNVPAPQYDNVLFRARDWLAAKLGGKKR